MQYFICILLLAVGIALVVKGGDWFVDAASWIAEVSGIPQFIIGATIVSLATTLPEILVSSISAGQGNVDMAVGNAVGSVNANISLIMAISLLFIPSIIKRKEYIAKTCFLVGAIALLWGFSALGKITWWMGLIVILICVGFFIENVIMAKKQAKLSQDNLEAPQEKEEVKLDENGKKIKEKIPRKVIAKNVILFVLGAGCIVGGAELMSIYGEKLAKLLNVPDAIIGVTILAVGTSLPELVTTITAIVKKKADLSVGNILGANIIDMTLILPLCAFISKGSLPVSSQSAVLDLPFCFAAAAFAFIPALIMGKFRRWQGGVLLAGYITYITLLILNITGVISIF